MHPVLVTHLAHYLQLVRGLKLRFGGSPLDDATRENHEEVPAVRSEQNLCMDMAVVGRALVDQSGIRTLPWQWRLVVGGWWGVWGGCAVATRPR